MDVKKVALAYSGGLDTSIIIPWLKENHDCEVVAVAVDVGQKDDGEKVKAKALKSGASEAYYLDVTEEFVIDYIFPMVKADAIYQGKYLNGTAIARPLIAKKIVEVAINTGCDAFCHGCTGKGNDQVRFELTFQAFAPDLPIIAPWRIWDIKSRPQAIDYAKERGISVPVTKEKPYSMDRNLWHISYEGGILEDPANEPLDDMFLTTTAPEKAPNTPEYLTIAFEKGIPVKVNDQKLAPVALIEKLNDLGAKHGIGRVDIVEDRLVGMKSRGVYETPGGTILMTAHKELEYLVLDKDTFRFKEEVARKYAELVYNGLWWSPFKKTLDAFVDAASENMTGWVKLKLYKGSITVVGRYADKSLYSESLATFDEDNVYSQKDSEGFIKLFGLQTKVASKVAGLKI
ncbi:MAG: argininosuccinate synthase [Firmicutes bacterium]|nr:argininosuccinate synthase [Bacillota bacterium]MDD4692896.1 argininosuccinate synthase [Bacillota bacterium]